MIRLCYMNLQIIVKKALSSRLFSNYAPQIYNSLSVEIKQCKSIDKFKSMLKSFLFLKSYDIERKVMREDYRLY